MAIDFLAFAAVTLLTTGISVSEDRKKTADIKEAQGEVVEAEKAIQTSQNARQRRKQVQEGQIAQAQIENVAAGTGTTGSSAPAVGIGSVGSQVGSNIGALETSILSQNKLTGARTSLFRAQNKMKSVGGTVAGAVGSGLISSFASKSGEKLTESLFTVTP